jgi:hypothetical protein
MKFSKDRWDDIQNMMVGMSKKMYKEMVKEMNIIASWEDSHPNNSAHWMYAIIYFFLLCIENLTIAWNTYFQLFYCRKEKKM